MGTTHFDRQYRLKCGAEGTVGFEIGNPGYRHNTALHISFSLEKTDSPTMNTSKFVVWNLNPEQLNTLAMTNCTVELCAGYGSTRPCIFKGTITNVITELDGADRMTTIEAIDGFAEISDTFVTLSYKGKTKAKTLLEDAAGKLGFPVVYSESAEKLLTDAELPEGYSYVGAAKNVLNDACNLATTIWTIQNGTLQVSKVGETITRTAQLISPDTGLIGVPKKIYNSAVAAGENTGSSLQDSLFGYEIIYFLNGAIGINDLIKLESKEVNGVFRVYKLSIDGDNLEGDWTCTAQVVEVE